MSCVGISVKYRVCLFKKKHLISCFTLRAQKLLENESFAGDHFPFFLSTKTVIHNVKIKSFLEQKASGYAKLLPRRVYK